MKWVSFLSIFILMVAFSFVILPTYVHALTLNDVINWIISGVTSQPSTGSIQGSAGGGESSTTAQIQCGGLVGIQCPTGYYCKIPEGCSDCYGVCTPNSDNSILCKSDYDCRSLVCTAVICHDTPRCISNKCVCGAGSSCLTTASTSTTTHIFCTNDFDCPSKMKCTNYTCPVCPTGAACAPCILNHCVDVGCVPEGGYIPGAISPEYRNHMATECCQGLNVISYSGYYDTNCNFAMNAGGPSGVCSKCGNGICESWETKCNCPQDCGGITTTTTTTIPSGCTGPISSNCKTDQDCQNQITTTYTCVQGQPCNPPVAKCYNNNCYLCTNKQPCPYDCCVGDSQYQDKVCPVFQPPCPNGVNCAQQQTCVNHKCIPSATSYTMNFKSGWNLFSVPVKNVFAISSTTCSPAGPIYGYSKGNYYQTTYTTGGNGYWVKMNSDCSETLSGASIAINDFSNLNQGWNLIGAPSTSTIFANIVGNCNVVSGPFWYNPSTNSYIQSSTLDPSKGYFVKVSADCQLGAGLPPSPPQ